MSLSLAAEWHHSCRRGTCCRQSACPASRSGSCDALFTSQCIVSIPLTCVQEVASRIPNIVLFRHAAGGLPRMSGKPRPSGRQRRNTPVAAVAAGPSKIKDSAQKIWGIVGRVRS